MTDYTLQIKIYSQSDLINSGCFNIKKAISVCEEGLRDYDKGNVCYMNKISMIFKESTQERINCLVAALNSEKICGMKWVSVFPDNPIVDNKANITAVIILSDLENGYPIAIMDGTLCTSLRTAAVSAIAAKYFSVQNPSVIGIIGTGEQAKMHFLAMKEVRPEIHICKVASRTMIHEKEFIDEMKEFHKDVEFISCRGNYKNATLDADIIVTAISGQNMILKGEWIKSGSFYCHVAGIEDEYSVARKADKIVCDNWEEVKHRKQTISQMFKEGKLKDEDIYADIHEVVCGYKKGREDKNEFIYFNAVGLPFLDVKFANWMRLNVENHYQIQKKTFLRNMSIFQEQIRKGKNEQQIFK